MRSAGTLLFLLFTFTAASAPVRLIDGNGAVVPIDGQLSAGEVTVPVKNGVAEIVLAAGESRDVVLRADGWWALPATVTASGADLRVWRTGTIRGHAVASDGVTLPAAFTAYIESPPEPIHAPPIPRGTTFPCPIAQDGAFSCELPAATLDVAFRSKGLTPHYRWSVPIEAGKTTDAGTLTWKRGASLVVWLDRDSMREAKAAKVTPKASLTRMVAGAPSATAARLALPVAEAEFNERGYAQLTPIEAGTFALQVTARGFANATFSPIDIREGSETVLRKPFALQPPLTISVALTPPLDPREERWRVTFQRLADTISPFGGTSHELIADAHGAFTIDGESAGQFLISVRDADGNRVVSKEITVSGLADAAQSITIEQQLVCGTVKLGKEPLAAEVIFGTRDGAERVTLRSRDDGTFAGALPRLGRWSVQVIGDDAIDATQIVTVKQDEPVEITVPDTVIAGNVVDAEGKPSPHARVTILRSSAGEFAEADDAGRFRVRGLSGHTVLFARAPRTAAESVKVTLEIAEGQHVDDVTLRLIDPRQVRGRVTTAGQPLPGAFVAVYPAAGGTAPRTTTDLDGRFTLNLRESETEGTFIIAAAGRTMSAVRRPLIDGEMLFDVEAAGGELVVRLPEQSDRFSIFSNGAQLGLQELFEWSSAHGRELLASPDTLAIPDLARGSYRACAHLVTGAEICRDAMLAPRASITIDLRSSGS